MRRDDSCSMLAALRRSMEFCTSKAMSSALKASLAPFIAFLMRSAKPSQFQLVSEFVNTSHAERICATVESHMSPNRCEVWAKLLAAASAVAPMAANAAVAAPLILPNVEPNPLALVDASLMPLSKPSFLRPSRTKRSPILDIVPVLEIADNVYQFILLLLADAG